MTSSNLYSNIHSVSCQQKGPGGGQEVVIRTPDTRNDCRHYEGDPKEKE